MKVLITSDWYTPAVNGVVTSVLNLRRQLQQQGHEVWVLTLSGSLHSYSEDGVIYIGSVDAGLLYPGARLRGAAVGAAVKAMIRWKPDVVHSQCEFSTFFLARKIAREVNAPLIHTYHTVYEDYTHYFSPSRRWGRQMAAHFSRYILAQCDWAIAPTEKVKMLLDGYGVNPPVSVIPTGIDLSRFEIRPCQQQTAKLKSRLGIPAKNKVLIYLGRLAKEKNIHELLQASAQFADSVTLLLVGGGPQQDALQAQAAQLGVTDRVIFTGMVKPEQVASYYALGDVFVSASSSETQGLTYIEALAAGLPCVCRADDCLTGVIENGTNGWQYESAEQMQDKLAELLENDVLRLAMAQRAAESAKKFSDRQFGASVQALYHAALNRRQEPVLRKENAAWRKA